MNSNLIILFCQAPKDVPYILKLYEQNKGKKVISIFVINIEGIYKFIKNLNLELDHLIFIPYKNIDFKNVLSLFLERKRINYLWKLHFQSIKSANVYFFAEFEDWLTASFIHRFSKIKEVKIMLMDHSMDNYSLFTIQNKLSPKTKVYLLLLKFLTNINFKAKIKEVIPEFPIEKYPILKTKVKMDPSILLKYGYNIHESNKSNILFFVSPCYSQYFECNSYNVIVVNTIKLIKELGFNVIAKGHPRLEIPASVKEIIDFEIPSYIPGEFINPKQYKICIGIYTNAICYFAKYKFLPTYSIMKLFPYVNESMFNSGILSMQTEADGLINFCDSFDKLKEALTQ